MALEKKTDKDWQTLKSDEVFPDEDSYNLGYLAILRRALFVHSISCLRKVKKMQNKLEEEEKDPNLLILDEIPNITEEDECIKIGQEFF